MFWCVHDIWCGFSGSFGWGFGFGLVRCGVFGHILFDFWLDGFGLTLVMLLSSGFIAFNVLNYVVESSICFGIFGMMVLIS